MKIEFKISIFKEATNATYAIPSFTEGRLSFVFDNVSIGPIDGFLLLEFAGVLKSWIDNSGSEQVKDFYYSSQDFEEDPSITFIEENEKFQITCYLNGIKSFHVDKQVVYQACRDYIANLVKQLNVEFSFDAGPIISEMARNKSIYKKRV